MTRRKLKYPNVPLPDGKLYTDFTGWHKYIVLVNKAAGRDTAGFGVACPCNSQPMTLGIVAFSCLACGDIISIAEVCDALGLPYDRYMYAPGMEATVG